MHKKPLVIILGGGYSGVRAALDLLKRKNSKVILIDRNAYHALPSQYYEVGAYFRPEDPQTLRKDFHELYHSASVSFDEIFNHSPLFDMIQDEAESVVPEDSLVVLKRGRRIHYDYLVVALGSATNYFGIARLENNAIGFKSVEEALNVRDRIDELFFSTPKQKKITIVIGGGGVTGCEFSSEVVGYIHKLSRAHSRPIGAWSCILVEASCSVLSSFSPWAQKKAHARLRKLGVTVLTDSPIVDVWPNLIHIGKEKRALPFDLLVWTAGVKGACSGDIIKNVPLQAKNCLPVNEYLQVGEHKNIFAVGDIAASFDLYTKTPLAMTAQKAVHEGKYAARAINQLIGNPSAVLRAYSPKRSSYVIPLGQKYAILETPYLRLSGFIPWFLKYIVLLKYVRTVVPLKRAVRFVVKEMRLFSQND